MARDPEFWFPPGEGRYVRKGRPVTRVQRLIRDYPPPTPQPTPCKLWQGAVDRFGYGMMADYKSGHGKRKYAHRWVWEAVNGPIPKGLVIRHRCDNPPCFRLSHLEIGTVADNNWDASERGHLGPERSMPPSLVIEIWNRHEAGESYRKIAPDYPSYSLATIKRVKVYIQECLDLIDSPTEGSTNPPIPWDAGAPDAGLPAADKSESEQADHR
jgi:hypothetical protein